MRINEKNIINYANSNAPTDKDGYLLKRGEVNKSFQKRWFVLKGNMLFYYDKRTDREPLGVVILEGCTIELSTTYTDTFTFEIIFKGPGCRTYFLTADSQKEMESWMKVVQCASYDYMKMMVTELQRQLDEVNQVTKVSTISKQPVGGADARPVSKHSASAGEAGPATRNLLIDFADTQGAAAADTVQRRVTVHSSKSERFNPFDKPDKPEYDLFGSKPFNSVLAVSAGEVKPRSSSFHVPLPDEPIRQISARTFIEMHEQFRCNIELRQLQYVERKSALLT